MAKTVRLKADPFVVTDMAEAETALKELAALERELRAITDSLNAEIDALKAAARRASAPCEARKKERVDALAVFLRMHRDLLPQGRKSLEFSFGAIGFRSSTALCQMKGVSPAMTLERLREAGLWEGIRRREEADKEAMRAWPQQRLALVGLARREREQFFVELKEEAVA